MSAEIGTPCVGALGLVLWLSDRTGVREVHRILVHGSAKRARGGARWDGGITLSPSNKTTTRGDSKMTKSSWMRLGVCMLAAVAMIAMLEGCAKKEKAAETPTTENTESTPETMANTAAAGTYTAAMANGTTSLMLNTDMSASFSLQPVAGAPAQVENGTWANGATANDVAVTFSKSPVDTTMSLTLNFTATGDTLALTNGDAVGMAGLKLV